MGAINKKLLRKVMAHIKAEPRRLDMAFLLEQTDKEYAAEDKSLPPCGTVGCIAGWACILDLKRFNAEDIAFNGWERGKKRLNLNEDQAHRLFSSPGDWEYSNGNEGRKWPEAFANRYNKAKTARGRMNATVARIEHFLKTNGKE